ncbi:MAG: amidase [Burkholderiales bacterium]|nr:amidase [Burkholderiales bacterium]
MPLPIAYRSARDLAALVRRGRISSVALLDLYLERLARHNPKLNAIVVRDVERARRRARAADRAAARGERWGPLHGVPMTIKESFDVAGLPSTWGIPALANNVAAANAVVVERLLAAGAVIFGKTNVPLLLSDWQSFNAVYGTTNNPWDVTRVPGGSSGGSAAALAAGLTALEYGSDIGASIRNPAHYCGVYGHKPTFDIVPLRGHALPGRLPKMDIAVAGPLARSAADLELALKVTAGPDVIEAAGLKLALPPCRRARLRDFRVAVMVDHPTAEVDRAVQDRIAAVARFAARRGAKVSDRARPAIDPHEAHRVYVMLLRAETSSALDDAAFARQLEAARTLPPDTEQYHRWLVEANTMRHRDWLAFNEERHRMRLAWADFFREWDVLLCPTATTAAFRHDQRGERWERMIEVNGKPQPTTTQLFWAGFPNMAYLPSTVAPAGLTPERLPVGVQIVGPQYGDLTTIGFAKLLERELGGFVPPPGYE